MLFGKTTDLLQRLLELVQGQAGKTEHLERRIDELFERTDGLIRQREETDQNTAEKMTRLSRSVSMHNAEIEELLDQWQQENENKQKLLEKSSREQAQIRELKTISMLALDQIWMIRQFAGQDPSWQRHLDILGRQMEEMLDTSHLEMIDEAEVPVDYAIHDVCEVMDTEDDRKDRQVRQILQPGYRFHNEIMRKAQVSAFRCREREQG